MSDLEIANCVANKALRPTVPEASFYSQLMLGAWAENVEERPTFSDILATLFEMYSAHLQLRSVYAADPGRAVVDPP
eukprot:12559551-Prorocentrum_lima.AAC.1